MSSVAASTTMSPAASGAESTGLKICDLIRSSITNSALQKPLIAFEYYPPKTEAGVVNLKKRFASMAQQKPLYIDVTWGAGGSTSDLTLDLCVQAKQDFGLEPNMHLTCTNMDIAKITGGLEGAKNAGIRNIVALRGDPPAGEEKWEATKGGFTCALDLVKHIRKEYQDYFCLSVAGYPEGHPTVIKDVEEGRVLTDSESKRVVYTTKDDGTTQLQVCFDEDYTKELVYLKEKCDAGADLIITQMFFDCDVMVQFIKDCRGAGITVPIIPGIMMISNYSGFKRMLGFCKTRVPADVSERVESLKDDKEGLKLYGVEFAKQVSTKLLENGIEVLHYYTLNYEGPVTKCLQALGRANEIVPVNK